MLSQGKYEEAIDEFKDLLKINVNDPIVVKHLINCLFKYGLYLDDGFTPDYKKAAQCYEKIIELDKNNTKAWYNLGILSFKQKKYEKAIEFYNKSLKINPKDKYVLYNMGLLYEDIKDYVLSLSYYNRSLKIDPSFSYAIQGKRESERMLKMSNESDTDLESINFHSFPKDFVDKLKRLIKISSEIKIEDIGIILHLNKEDVLNLIILWAEKFEFKINGDFLVLNESKLDNFLTYLANYEI